jgi:hypothetical protein
VLVIGATLSQVIRNKVAKGEHKPSINVAIEEIIEGYNALGMLLSFSLEPNLSHTFILYYCFILDTENI